MQDLELLKEFLDSETENEVIAALTSRGLLHDEARWKYVGNMPNNQSIVQAQQSTAAAALVEKYTNGVDAILLRHCKAKKIDPRGSNAPSSMSKAIDDYFGEISDPRLIAEENLVLYATGSKERPSLSLYDNGEGQHAKDFPSTFCSLISGSTDGSYKGAIPFVQGRFNMGGTGVLPFCSDKYKLQLIVSRVPSAIAGSSNHEWAFTLFCFFPDKQKPSWKYLVGVDGSVMTAGTAPLHLLPKKSAKSGELCAPRERAVVSGTLVKMYDFKAPRSNVCGELFRKLEEYLLRPPLPLRIIECRKSYEAKVMGVNVWDRLGAWSKDKMEEGFEEGASISIKLDSGETVPGEIRVFKSTSKDSTKDEDQPQTGLRALINGQSHARRDAQFFKTKAVDKEHIAGSMLVTLDCTELGQDARNALFMSNRETFREDPLLTELFRKLQKELKDHPGLIQLNLKRYEQKIKDAIDDEEGISALEELLQTDPDLADLFGTPKSGKVAAKTAKDGNGGKIDAPPESFKGFEFPSYFHRADKTTSFSGEVQQGGTTRVSFRTDVKNNYFSRKKFRGKCAIEGDFQPNLRLFNGVLTLTCSADKHHEIGKQLSVRATISDNHGSGPFVLLIFLTVVPSQAEEETESPEPKPPRPPKAQSGPSRPDIKELDRAPDDLPLTIEPVPNTSRLQLVLNRKSQLLEDAKKLRPKEEEPAVNFVFKYGLALAAMGLLDAAKRTDEWKTDESKCRTQIQDSARGIARVIVPLCLSLPKSIPKMK